MCLHPCNISVETVTKHSRRKRQIRYRNTYSMTSLSWLGADISIKVTELN